MFGFLSVLLLYSLFFFGAVRPVETYIVFFFVVKIQNLDQIRFHLRQRRAQARDALVGFHIGPGYGAISTESMLTFTSFWRSLPRSVFVASLIAARYKYPAGFLTKSLGGGAPRIT